jgi:hypothetical protein
MARFLRLALLAVAVAAAAAKPVQLSSSAILFYTSGEAVDRGARRRPRPAAARPDPGNRTF